MTLDARGPATRAKICDAWAETARSAETCGDLRGRAGTCGDVRTYGDEDAQNHARRADAQNTRGAGRAETGACGRVDVRGAEDVQGHLKAKNAFGVCEEVPEVRGREDVPAAETCRSLRDEGRKPCADSWDARIAGMRGYLRDVPGTRGRAGTSLGRAETRGLRRREDAGVTGRTETGHTGRAATGAAEGHVETWEVRSCGDARRRGLRTCGYETCEDSRRRR